MVKKDKNNFLKIIILIVVILLLLFGMRGCLGVGIDYKAPVGIEEYKGGWSTAIKNMLGVERDPDWIDDETGEEFCFNYECNYEASETYMSCIGEDLDDEVEFTVNKIMSYVEIIPVVYAIAYIDDDLEALCFEAYETTLFTDCVETCNEEFYEWDGREINDIGEFYATGFPNAVNAWRDRCESWLHGGTWVQESNRIGCINGVWLGCESDSVISGGEVCELVNHNFVCGDGENILCEVND